MVPQYWPAAPTCCCGPVSPGHQIILCGRAAHDAGKVLNPNGATGQVIGGMMQGLGLALAEVVAVDAIFAAVHEDSGPLGAKTIAEPPLIPVAACVANAIHDALGIRQNRLPMTSERVWRSI